MTFSAFRVSRDPETVRYKMKLPCSLFCVLFLLTGVLTVIADPIDHDSLVRTKRAASSPSPDDRPSCPPGAKVSPIRVDTTARLASLRNLFSTNGGIHAYIIPSEDAHQSEYPAAYDKRRGYISGFSGSAGTAVVLEQKAALWTDGRYFLEAEDKLDCNWILMKSGVDGVPTITEWLKTELKDKSNVKVGADPFLMSSSTWKSYTNTLGKVGIIMTSVDSDLVDQIWTTDRPKQPSTPINALAEKFAGKTWQTKIQEVRTKMSEKSAKALIVSSLDETAWLFNLRASDIAYNPFFISYAIVEDDKIRLYILEKDTKLTQNPADTETKQKLHEHLNTGTTGSCTGKTSPCVEVIEYNSSRVTTDVAAIAAGNGNPKIWTTLNCNQAIFSRIPEAQRIQDKSTIALMKSMKNDVERTGMQTSHIRDAVALITFVEMLEREVKEGKYWTEVSADAELKKTREKTEYNRGLSFNTIAGVGSNGAIIHYRPQNATNKQITTNEMFLLDSGGQYLDGTTDVTRTFHFGNPTDYEKECYTRVLMGHIDLALLKWPKGLYGRQIDAVSRAPLWDVGLRYRHGTGHGIGAYLSVHEGPGRISLAHALNPADQPLDEHMFFSDEPGYYEDGKFGIRLETIVMIEKIKTKYSFQNTTFLSFRPITLVPYEPHLIKYDMLSPKQIDWLNKYNKRVENEVGPKLKDQKVIDWMKKRTKQVTTTTTGDATSRSTSAAMAVAITFTFLWIVLN